MSPVPVNEALTAHECPIASTIGAVKPCVDVSVTAVSPGAAHGAAENAGAVTLEDRGTRIPVTCISGSRFDCPCIHHTIHPGCGIGISYHM